MPLINTYFIGGNKTAAALQVRRTDNVVVYATAPQPGSVRFESQLEWESLSDVCVLTRTGVLKKLGV